MAGWIDALDGSMEFRELEIDNSCGFQVCSPRACSLSAQLMQRGRLSPPVESILPDDLH